MFKRQLFHGRVLKAAVFLTVTTSLAIAQTPVTVPKNKHTPAQDVELGQRKSRSSCRFSGTTASSPSWIESAGAWSR
jgi:hypothetical protein